MKILTRRLTDIAIHVLKFVDNRFRIQSPMEAYQSTEIVLYREKTSLTFAMKDLAPEMKRLRCVRKILNGHWMIPYVMHRNVD